MGHYKNMEIDMHNFIYFLENERGYPKESIVSGYNNFDIILVEKITKKIGAIIEFKLVKDVREYNNKTKEFSKQLKKYYEAVEDHVDVYLVLFDKEGNKKYFLTVEHQLFKGDDFLEIEEFPSYREVFGSKIIAIKEEKEVEVNINYMRFKIFCRILGGLSILLFLLSLYKCDIHLLKFNIIKKYCYINLTYQNIILFGVGIVLILAPFLRKIKTKRFEIDWNENNTKEL